MNEKDKRHYYQKNFRYGWIDKEDEKRYGKKYVSSTAINN